MSLRSVVNVLVLWWAMRGWGGVMFRSGVPRGKSGKGELARNYSRFGDKKYLRVEKVSRVAFRLLMSWNWSSCLFVRLQRSCAG